MPKAGKKEAPKQRKVKDPTAGLPPLNLNAAGIDVGSTEHYVAVPAGRDAQSVRTFKTFTADLHQMAAWLKKCGIETVVMESTGVYWIPLYQVLESRGFDVQVVNARHVKNVPGRKTDVQDCQWLQQLHTFGLLSNSFHPPDMISTYRALCRHRENLIASAATCVQHMQKALIEMNVQLSHVISDIAGETGMAILRAIVRGERDPLKLAELKNPRLKTPHGDLVKSLQGNWRDEQVFVLEQSLWLYDGFQSRIKECDERIEEHLLRFEDRRANPDPAPARTLPLKKSRGNTPLFDLQAHLHRMCGVDLTRVDGLDVLTVQTVISEVGYDMSAWKTAGHFASWLGICPNHRITGGKILRRRSRKIPSRAAKAFRLGAWALYRSQSPLGAAYRRYRTRLGAPKAITAMAHRLARIFYAMLKYSVEFNDAMVESAEAKHREYQLKRLEKQAQALGMELVLKKQVG